MLQDPYKKLAKEDPKSNSKFFSTHFVNIGTYKKEGFLQNTHPA